MKKPSLGAIHVISLYLYLQAPFMHLQVAFNTFHLCTKLPLCARGFAAVVFNNPTGEELSLSRPYFVIKFLGLEIRRYFFFLIKRKYGAGM